MKKENHGQHRTLRPVKILPTDEGKVKIAGTNSLRGSIGSRVHRREFLRQKGKGTGGESGFVPRDRQHQEYKCGSKYKEVI